MERFRPLPSSLSWSSWPISRILLAIGKQSLARQSPGDHLSGSAIANTLVQPTRASNGTSRPFALLGLAPGGVCLAGDITATAGGLLHHRFTLTGGCEAVAGNLPLCCTIPSGHPARPLAGAMLYGVRTFLS